MAVIRLIISLLCALGLAFAPVTAGAAPASGSMPGCTMGKEMPRKTADQGKMDCCAPACQAPSATALLPNRDGTEAVVAATGPKLAWAPAKELASLPSSGLDPPPRA